MDTSVLQGIELSWRASYAMRRESGSVAARSPSSIRRYQKVFRENWEYNILTWWDDNTTPDSVLEHPPW